MKLRNQNHRGAACILLISMFLQSCGVDVPLAQLQHERPATVHGGPIAEGRDDASVIPEMQIESYPTSGTSSRPHSVPGSSAAQPITQRPYDTQPSHRFITNIRSTQELVRAFSRPQLSIDQEKELESWLRAYVDYFKQLDLIRGPGLDTENLTNYLEEYKRWAQLPIQGKEKRKELLREHFYSLYDKVGVLQEATANREKPLMGALLHVFQNIDTSIFRKEDVSQLQILLTKKLLPSVDPGTRAKFSPTTYISDAPILENIYEVLRIIRIIDPSNWNTAPGSLYTKAKEQLVSIIAASQHYPTCYHAHVLMHSLDKYKEEEDPLNGLSQGVQGVYALYKFGVAIQGLLPQVTQPLPDLESIPRALEALQECYGHFKKAHEKLRQAANSINRSYTFYDYHQALQLAGALVLQTQCGAKGSYYADFQYYLQDIESCLKRPKKLSKVDRKALRYLVVRQLTLLAVKSTDPSICKASLDKLDEISKEWTKSIDHNRVPIIYELLDGLALIYNQRKDTDKDRAGYILRKLVKRLEFASVNLWSWTKRQHTHLVLSTWLDSPSSASIQGYDRVTWKLSSASFRSRGQRLEVGDLFMSVKENIEAEPSSFLSLAQLQSALKGSYQHPDFSEISSFMGGPTMSAEETECHLRLSQRSTGNERLGYDPKEKQDHLTVRETRLQRVEGRIRLENLFENRNLRPGGPAKQIDKVLLIGEPGTGKTVLTKKLAYDWATGKWGQHFQAVYVLPVRALGTDKYNGADYLRHETLATAIANQCFKGMRDAESFRQLCGRIQASLGRATTLVILDGLDERHGASEIILGEAKGRKHRLLLTSRPYDIAHERKLADIEVDHMGLDIRQRDRFVYRTLVESQTNTAKGFLNFIKRHRLEEISLTPVNLKILCTLWEDKGASMAGWRSPMGMPALYWALANFVWERFARESLARVGQKHGKEHKVKLFEDLEQIALASFQRGEIIIKLDTIEEVTGEFDYPLAKDAAFLLFQEIDSKYQFPHLTFHEYFIGRRLARQFLRDADKEIAAFLKAHMYEPRYGRAFSFMAGEISKHMLREVKDGIHKNSLDSIRALLKLANSMAEEQTRSCPQSLDC